MCDDLVNQVFQRGRRAEAVAGIARIAPENHPPVLIPADELIRSAADDQPVPDVVFVEFFPVERPVVSMEQVTRQRRKPERDRQRTVIRLAPAHLEFIRIDHRHAFEVLKVDPARFAVHVRILDRVDQEFEIPGGDFDVAVLFSGHRIGEVVPVNSSAEFDPVNLVVFGNRPRLGQRRLELLRPFVIAVGQRGVAEIVELRGGRFVVDERIHVRGIGLRRLDQAAADRRGGVEKFGVGELALLLFRRRNGRGGAGRKAARRQFVEFGEDPHIALPHPVHRRHQQVAEQGEDQDQNGEDELEIAVAAHWFAAPISG
ncbi:hypothetical protein SDC9_153600 [bioreactor metagenome]|uniref:Uncharacterized protein n=1 Tax=bioreactor metagenome TaxID=1076179 RepID=A0A645F146_9ZZZZ